MNLKKLVTVIVVGFAFCLMLNVPCKAATTTKATTKATAAESMVASKKMKRKGMRAYTAKELRYMTSIIYCEARGEGYQGQKAVGIVVMNRVRSELFPNTIKKVIYQRGQFTPVRNGSLNRALSLYDLQTQSGEMDATMTSCMEAAREVLSGSTTINVNGKTKQMKNYLFFSRRVANAKFTLGAHQFK